VHVPHVFLGVSCHTFFALLTSEMKQTRSATPFGGSGGIHFDCELFALPVEQPLGSQA